MFESQKRPTGSSYALLVTARKEQTMQYVLSGFSHEMGFRVFAFQGVGVDHALTEYSVKADLAAIRRYGIRLQELPLLCRGILERRATAEEQRTFTYTEADMSLHASVCTAQALTQNKRTPRRSPIQDAGADTRDPRNRGIAYLGHAQSSIDKRDV